MIYTRKQLHEDIDKLLNENGYEEDLSVKYGKLIWEVHFRRGKVETKFTERTSTREHEQ